MDANITLKKILKRVILVLLAIAGYIFLVPFWFGKRKNKLVILRYHSISNHRRHEVNVKVEVFRKQMEYLAKNYRPVSLQKAVEYLKSDKCLPENSVVISLDDGYKDNYFNAWPIFKQLNIPATVFLTAGYVGTDKILAHDIPDNPFYNYLLSWDEVRQMSRNGIEFGSHTKNHANLGMDGVDIKNEIEESKKLIEKELKKNVWAISYPFGLIRDFNKEAKQIAMQAGYTCGCSAMNGANDANSDLFELRRIGIEASDNMFTFRAKLNGALDLLVIKDMPFFNKLLRLFNKLISV
jgi:peptidoglycan/xylan/chitin deacetylase (PgdA/CDA1 family)